LVPLQQDLASFYLPPSTENPTNGNPARLVAGTLVAKIKINFKNINYQKVANTCSWQRYLRILTNLKLPKRNWLNDEQLLRDWLSCVIWLEDNLYFLLI